MRRDRKIGERAVARARLPFVSAALPIVRQHRLQRLAALADDVHVGRAAAGAPVKRCAAFSNTILRVT